MHGGTPGYNCAAHGLSHFGERSFQDSHSNIRLNPSAAVSVERDILYPTKALLEINTVRPSKTCDRVYPIAQAKNVFRKYKDENTTQCESI